MSKTDINAVIIQNKLTTNAQDWQNFRWNLRQKRYTNKTIDEPILLCLATNGIGMTMSLQFKKQRIQHCLQITKVLNLVPQLLRRIRDGRCCWGWENRDLSNLFWLGDAAYLKAENVHLSSFSFCHDRISRALMFVRWQGGCLTGRVGCCLPSEFWIHVGRVAESFQQGTHFVTPDIKGRDIQSWQNQKHNK